uniref:Hexosyltransferase n=1 Tax=Caligus clemensi TaxID=344056 RepID=C1C0Q9_CALCM|nr:Beta-1,3-galactosyltransferase 1 [Caligus clemensi]
MMLSRIFTNLTSLNPLNFIFLILGFLILNLNVLKLMWDLERSNSKLTPCEMKTRLTLDHLVTKDWVYKYESYSGGVVVPGWLPNASRDINDYLPKNNLSFLVTPKNIDPSTELLILIKTRVINKEARSRIRNSWYRLLMRLHSRSKIIFVLGRNGSNWSIPELSDEIEGYGDILVGNFIDTYYNLTLKLVSAFEFTLNTEWKPKIVVTVDDDMFINVPVFLRKIKDLNSNCEGPYLLGYTGANYQPLVDNSNNKNIRKWGVPPYLASSNQSFPPYTHGAMVIMSFETVECIYKEAFNLPFFHIDDAFITGFCPYRCGIRPVQLENMQLGSINQQRFNVSSYIVSRINNYDIFRIHNDIINYYNLTHIT